MTTSGRGREGPVAARWALAAYAVLLGVMLLAPSSAAPSWLVATVSRLAVEAGVPAGLAATARIELLLNVAAFVPLTALGGVVWQHLTWRDWTALGFVGSLLVEVVQALVLEGRSATHSDVVANTAGALLGALAAGLTVRLVRSS